MQATVTGPIGARGLTFATAAGYTCVVDAVLTRIATVIIANRPAHWATALDAALLTWTTATVVADQTIRRAAAVHGTSAWIFAANAAAKPTLRTAFTWLNANLFISTTCVAADFFFPAAEAAEAHSVSSTVIKVITLNLAIPCVFTPYYTQFFIIHTFEFFWNNWRSIL